MSSLCNYEQAMLDRLGGTDCSPFQEEIVDELTDISDDEKSLPMIYPSRGRRFDLMMMESTGGDDEKGNENLVNLLREVVEDDAAVEADGEESDDVNEVGLKQFESIVQSTTLHGDEGDHYERGRQSCR